MRFRVLNNARTVLTGIAVAGDGSLIVEDDTLFALGADEYTYITLEDELSNIEICKLTSTSPGFLNVTRGQDETIAIDWGIGAIVECRPCRAAWDAFKSELYTLIGDPPVLTFLSTRTELDDGDQIAVINFDQSDEDGPGTSASIQVLSDGGGPNAYLAFFVGTPEDEALTQAFEIREDYVKVREHLSVNKTYSGDGNTVQVAGGLFLGDGEDASGGSINAVINIGDALAVQQASGDTQYGIVCNVTYGDSCSEAATDFLSTGNGRDGDDPYSTDVHSGFQKSDFTLGANQTLTNQYGLRINDLEAAENNFGVFSTMSAGTDKFFLYGSGDAKSYLSGKLNIGGSDANIGSSTGLEVKTNTGTQAAFARYSNDVSGPIAAFYKTRHASPTGHVAVDAGDFLGQINFYGSDGANYALGAMIRAVAAEDFNASDNGTNLLFHTKEKETVTMRTRMLISATGDSSQDQVYIGPDSDTAPTRNGSSGMVHAKNTCKAFGRATTDPSPTLFAHHNISSVVTTGSQIRFNFSTPFESQHYSLTYSIESVSDSFMTNPTIWEQSEGYCVIERANGSRIAIHIYE